MSTMKRFKPKRSFSTAVGGPNAGRREAGIVFGSGATTAARQAGPIVALPGAARAPARAPVRFDMPSAAFDGMRGLAGQGLEGEARIERDDALPAGTMRVTYADGSTELLSVPRR